MCWALSFEKSLLSSNLFEKWTILLSTLEVAIIFELQTLQLTLTTPTNWLVYIYNLRNNNSYYKMKNKEKKNEKINQIHWMARHKDY